MKKIVLIMQLLLTLFILAFIQNNFYKVSLLLPLWWISFGGLTRKEFLAYLCINIFFVISDIGAIQNGFFKFTNPDFLGLPVWEFFMWGFYLIHTHRLFPAKVPKSLDLKLLMLAIIFSQLFAIIHDRELLLISTSGILLLSLIFYHDKEDIFYCFYLMAVGVATEYVGIRFNLWSYPERDYNSAWLQFVIMWGAAGLYFRHIAGHWLMQQKIVPATYKKSHQVLSADVQTEMTNGAVLAAQKNYSLADETFSNIEKNARRNSDELNYQFYIQYSALSIASGNLRKAIELSREGLPLATSRLERAALYLQLCRIYRMMILMKNARFELNRAFQEMKIHAPTNSVLQAIKSSVIYIFQSFQSVTIVEDANRRRYLELQVELYEEAGLSAYYFLEFPMLVQCSLNAKRPAYQLGDSIQMVNWLGGSGCAWSVLGLQSKGSKLIQKAIEVGRKMEDPYGAAKANFWSALTLSYKDLAQQSGDEFMAILKDPFSRLSPYELRLAATTLSCNHLIRGHMQSSEKSIRDLTAKDVALSRYFSTGKAFVDWYRLPSLGFLGNENEAKVVLHNSQVVFNRVDEEKWQIAQFLGGLLIYYYSLPEKNLKDIDNCIERFDSLKLSPQLTYLEAGHVWVAKAHLFIDLVRQGKLELAQAKKAVHQLGQMRTNSVIKGHYLVAKAKLLLIESKSNLRKSEALCAQALQLAKSQDNIWVEFEILKFKTMKQASSPLQEEAIKQFKSFCNEHNWKGVSI